MKAMVCEMCSGNDLVKQDGVYVCQHCGTKYTVEEAKKLILDAPIEVEGISTLEKMLADAEALIKIGNESDARKKLEEATEKYPGDYRAWMAFARMEDNPLAQVRYSNNALAVAPEDKKAEIEAEQIPYKKGVADFEDRMQRQLDREKRKAKQDKAFDIGCFLGLAVGAVILLIIFVNSCL